MKQTETVRAETAPAVSKTRKLKADSIACIYGVELFTLGWIAGMLSAFFGYPLQAALITLAAAGIAAALLRKRALPVLLIAAGFLPMTKHSVSRCLRSTERQCSVPEQ